ncbi:hypothetical protein BC937DRAFT_90125 [Endogone sp. FLAS-F59071]|nr:hypothetical protein BC937DRAFT_90125 [Endogone sp. FLAS-F59071]|eukprot:RUS22170.1 hypothetical protein BC937DRAFT_90125 [Endogone sp. FLAS-F59071]
MAYSNNTNTSLDIDLTTQQTVSNVTTFAVNFTICSLALLLQVYNCWQTIHKSHGRSRGFFFYASLTSGIFCALIFVGLGGQSLLVYLSGHSHAFFESIISAKDLSEYPDYRILLRKYDIFSRSYNISLSIFSLIFVWCVQIRFRCIRALIRYPPWVDRFLVVLTFLVWFGTEGWFNVINFDNSTSAGEYAGASWSVYVLINDNAMSVILWWTIRRAFAKARDHSTSTVQMNKTIMIGLLSMCIFMWGFLILFVINIFSFKAESQRNTSAIIYRLSFSSLPLVFSCTHVWMTAVRNMYERKGTRQESYTSRIGTIHVHTNTHYDRNNTAIQSKPATPRIQPNTEPAEPDRAYLRDYTYEVAMERIRSVATSESDLEDGLHYQAWRSPS